MFLFCKNNLCLAAQIKWEKCVLKEGYYKKRCSFLAFILCSNDGSGQYIFSWLVFRNNLLVIT